MSPDDAKGLRRLDPVRLVAISPVSSRYGIISAESRGRVEAVVLDGFAQTGVVTVRVWFGGIHGIVEVSSWEIERT